MLLLKLWNYIRGYVNIYVEGYFLEKFINICIHRQIFLWDIKKHKESVMTLKISIKGFKLLRPIAKKTKCRVRIIRKKGLPFVLNRYKKRKTFVIGAVVFVLLFYVMSSFIWSVEITGNDKIDDSVITAKLNSLGISPGILKYNIDTKKVASEMMMEMHELSWIGVTVKGTKVKVEVVESKLPPELVPKDIPCDIVASKDGFIKSIVTTSGQDLVKGGDTVKAGQVLITGTVTSKTEGVEPRLVHATGTVEARTWYEGNCQVSTKISEKVRTGASKSNYTLVLFAKKINLFHGKVKFANYDMVEEDKNMSIGKDLALPFGLNIDRYYESKIVEKTVSLEEAREIAADNAYKEAADGIPESAKIINTTTNFLEKEGQPLTANVIIECVEDIGKAVRIGGN